VNIQLPALRARPEDIGDLVAYFLEAHRTRHNIQVPPLSNAAMRLLERHPWPGNIRELENLIERAVLLSPGKELRVPLAELKPGTGLADPAALFASQGASVTATASIATLEEAERQHIMRALRQTEWRIAGARGAATILGMKRTTLQARMRKLGIRRPI